MVVASFLRGAFCQGISGGFETLLVNFSQWTLLRNKILRVVRKSPQEGSRQVSGNC